ncbi:hypothetical protein BH24ACT3_BH24ACT3_09200 [soil metagenome]
MTPTLFGRIQTRIFAIAVIGGIWTLLITPLLPGTGGASLGDVYEVTITVLIVVTVVGIGWELLYHGLQQFRWEKDWPTLVGLLTGINEGILAYLLLDAGLAPNLDAAPPGSTFFWHFATTWLVAFLFLNGPMRVPFIRWRFRGGRII